MSASFKTSREAALHILLRVDAGAYSDLLLKQVLDRSSLSKEEKALTTELVYGTIQRQNTLDHVLFSFLKRKSKKLAPWVVPLLRLSIYQIHYLRIPDHAAVHEAVKIAKKKGHAGIAGLVNAVLRNVLRHQPEPSRYDDLPAVRRISFTHSHPEWLVERWFKQYGEGETVEMCQANLERPPVSIRVNKLQNDRETLLRYFKDQEVRATASQVTPLGIRIERGGNPTQFAVYEAGAYSIQGESSMLVAESLDPQPGMMVLDACAAPGGKTTHLAERMQDRGTVWANDLHSHKQTLIDQQIQRLGLQCVRTRTGDAANLQDAFAPETFDRILLDAPCSGLGVIRRKPDLKWVKNETEIAALSAIQQRLLTSLAPLLKPGGIMVYSTCTTEREENAQVVEAFLEQHSNFEWAPWEFENEDLRRKLLENAIARTQHLGMMQILPHDFQSDGFFIARLRKSEKL